MRPFRTKHTPEHTQTVELIAGWMLPDELIDELTDDEIAFLILACHYHDLGMVGIEEDTVTAKNRDRVRRDHAVSIGDRILEHWSIGYLMLASQRADVSITIHNTAAAPFQFLGLPNDTNQEFPSGQPIAIMLGPGELVRPKTVSFRASFKFDLQRKVLDITAFKLADRDPSDRPLLFQFSKARLNGIAFMPDRLISAVRS